jgi:protein-disulfide isomerase
MQRRYVLAAGLGGLALGPAGLATRAARADVRDDELFIGAADAPVTVIEYASLTCGHCAAFHAETLPLLKERYVEPGQVRMVYRDFPLNQAALQAALVARCAGPDRFFQFLSVLFETQRSWATAADPVAALKQIAALGGLRPEQVDACLADTSLEGAILQTRLEAEQRYGINSTPSFVIGERVLVGHRSIGEFAAVIDPLLPS